MPLCLKLFTLPSAWPVLLGYGIVPIVLGTALVVKGRITSYIGAIIAGLVLGLTTFITTPLFDSFWNIPDVVQDALPFSELILAVLVLVAAVGLRRMFRHDTTGAGLSTSRKGSGGALTAGLAGLWKRRKAAILAAGAVLVAAGGATYIYHLVTYNPCIHKQGLAVAECLGWGQCAYLDGKCVAVTDDDCRQSIVCQGSGLCTARNGKCVASETASGQLEAPLDGQASEARNVVDWVPLGGGTFRMGSDAGKPEERPVHTVTLSGFEIARTEVTVRQYRACVDAGVCTVPDTGRLCSWWEMGKEEHPVNCVDWNQARAFSRWVGGDLCTEAQWEYAARSGGKDRTYPWGDEQATCARAVVDDGNGFGCGKDRAWLVCSKEKGNTDQGLCDMAGNVWEWAQDFYGPYAVGESTDSMGPDAGTSRVVRGSCWRGLGKWSSTTARSGFDPTDRLGVVGLRPCRTR
jgi:formylglycine-generating enzyme required for sulfatase activity